MKDRAHLVGIALIERVEIVLHHGFYGRTVMAHGGLSSGCHFGAREARTRNLFRLCRDPGFDAPHRPGMTAAPSHQKHALAVDLLVEQRVSLLGLVELPAMGEQLI